MALRLNGQTTGYTELNAPANGDSVILTMPGTDGNAGQYLQTNGSGTLSWQTVTSTEYQGPAFSASLSAHQSFSSATWTKVQFDSEAFDTDGCYDNSTNYRFTPTKAGYYQVNLKVYLDYTQSVGTQARAGLYKNGTRIASSDTNASNFYGTRSINEVVYLNGSTDYLEGYGYYNGASVRFYVNGVTTNNFSAVWVHE